MIKCCYCATEFDSVNANVGDLCPFCLGDTLVEESSVNEKISFGYQCDDCSIFFDLPRKPFTNVAYETCPKCYSVNFTKLKMHPVVETKDKITFSNAEFEKLPIREQVFLLARYKQNDWGKWSLSAEQTRILTDMSLHDMELSQWTEHNWDNLTDQHHCEYYAIYSTIWGVPPPEVL